MRLPKQDKPLPRGSLGGLAAGGMRRGVTLSGQCRDCIRDCGQLRNPVRRMWCRLNCRSTMCPTV